MKKPVVVLIVLLTVVLFAACTADSIPVDPTRPVSKATTTPNATASPTAVSPTPNILPAATASPTATTELFAVPTSDVVSGWLTYENDFYGYHFSYPPGASIETHGVTGFPSEELPEDMTSAAYLRQLKTAYPDDLCVQVRYRTGFVVFQLPTDAGGKYATPCGGAGVGAYDLEVVTETVLIDGYPYTAEGFQARQRDEDATWHSEFYFVTLGDGFKIHFGSMSDSQDQFLEVKETLLQIVASFTSEATTFPVPTPTPTPIPGLVASAAHITVGDWSPDGRFLTYWTHTAEDLNTNPQFPTGNFHFYSTDQEQSCRFGGYRTGSTGWQRRHLWLPNGDILIFGDEDVRSFYPCSLNFVILTDEFPEPIRRIIAHDVERTRFLLASESSYWLFRADGLDAQPVTGFAEGFDNGASFSPNSRLVALTGDNGGSYLLDTASATVTKLADWEARGHLAGPEWLDNERFLIHGSHDRGPLIIGIDGSVQNLGLALFGRATGPEDIAFAMREPESGTFHLLLKTPAGSLSLYHSELDAVTEISMPSAGHVDASFSPNGRWLLLTTRATGNPPRAQLWTRVVDPTVSQPTRIYSGEDVPFTRLGPDDSLALKVGHYINILHLPHGERMAGQGYGRYEPFPSSWSPDGRFLAVIGNAQEDQEQALFVLPVHASPEGGS